MGEPVFNYAIDLENRIYHILFGESSTSTYCGVRLSNMQIQNSQPQTFKKCKRCQWVVDGDMPQGTFVNQPPTTVERLQSTEEMLMMTLFKSWGNRIDREIEILKLQQVDKSKLEGLADLVGEIKEASDSMANAWMIAKFGNINNP